MFTQSWYRPREPALDEGCLQCQLLQWRLLLHKHRVTLVLCAALPIHILRQRPCTKLNDKWKVAFNIKITETGKLPVKITICIWLIRVNLAKKKWQKNTIYLPFISTWRLIQWRQFVLGTIGHVGVESTLALLKYTILKLPSLPTTSIASAVAIQEKSGHVVTQNWRKRKKNKTLDRLCGNL